jgi:hypothetical protein
MKRTFLDGRNGAAGKRITLEKPFIKTDSFKKIIVDMTSV